MSRPPSENDRGLSREHPWERARRLAFAKWETEVHRVAYGQSVPDLAGFARAIEPPAHWVDSALAHRMFAFSALPTGPGPVYLAAVPVRQRLPPEGALIRLPHATKGILPSSNPSYGELFLDAGARIEPASWEDIQAEISPGAAERLVPQLADLWHLAAPVVETLLLPLVGTLPWHGQSAGVDLSIEVEGWSLARHRSFLSGLLCLIPEWVGLSRYRSAVSSSELELASGARIRRPRSSVAVPFSVRLRSRSSPAKPASRGPTPAHSVITYGRSLLSEFLGHLSAGDPVLLLGRDEVRRVPLGSVDVPDPLRSIVWGLHWWNPTPPDAPEWYRWTRSELPRLVRALGELPSLEPGNSDASWEALVGRREFRDRLAQTAFARARLRGASEVEEGDLTRTVDSIIQTARRAIAWASESRGPLARDIDRTEGARTSRVRACLERLVAERVEGISVEEALRALRSQHLSTNDREVEEQLERLRIRGRFFQDRSGRYRLA